MGFQGQPFAFDSPAAAIDAVVARVRSGGVPRRERIALAGARGRVLAEPVVIDRDSPAFDHSAMDGYAVCAAALSRLVAPGWSASDELELVVAGESRIGSAPPALPAGRTSVAVRIATGAPIPSGADAVIRREDAVEVGEGHGGVRSIRVALPAAARVKSGDHVRRRGENAAAGAEALGVGGALSAAQIGVLASVGATAPLVFARLRVAIVTTGEELVDAASSPGPYQLRNSNGPAISAMLGSQGWAHVVSATHVDDDARLDELLRELSAGADAIVLTGGVSVGHRDPVRRAVDRVGAEVVFHGLPQRPGKPMLGAVLRRAADEGSPAVPIFGLPGNPVSALVTCARVVLPVLGSVAGLSGSPLCCVPRIVEVANPDGRTLDLWWHRLVRLRDGAGVELVDGRGSGDLIAAARSDGFIEVPPGSVGGPVPFFAWPLGA